MRLYNAFNLEKFRMLYNFEIRRDEANEIFGSCSDASKLTSNNTPELPIQNDSQLVEITFQDNGAGYSKNELEKIFDIFPHFENDGKEKSDGSGLVYCRKIVRNHGGSIAAESEPGKGIAFSVILPINAHVMRIN